MIITSKLSNEALLDAIYKAAAEYSKLIGNSYLIIGKNKNTDYYGFQCYFEKKHFMHLLGIDSQTLTATEFYDKCDRYNKGEGEGIAIRILIGMDIIKHGDFSITNVNGKTTFSFRTPSVKEIDYVKESRNIEE